MKGKIINKIFKATITFCIFSISYSVIHAQSMCECKSDYGIIKCDTTKIKDVGILVRSCDADSIYYYLVPFDNQRKLRITSFEMVYGPLDYRLGAVVVKQTKRCVKFKFGCTSTGDLCLYKFYNIKTGKLYNTEE